MYFRAGFNPYPGVHLWYNNLITGKNRGKWKFLSDWKYEDCIEAVSMVIEPSKTNTSISFRSSTHFSVDDSSVANNFYFPDLGFAGECLR